MKKYLNHISHNEKTYYVILSTIKLIYLNNNVILPSNKNMSGSQEKVFDFHFKGSVGKRIR